VLARVFCRQIRRRADSAGQLVAVSQMLPRPEDCWLELEGERSRLHTQRTFDLAQVDRP
jgi:hypothetical protein